VAAGRVHITPAKEDAPGGRPLEAQDESGRGGLPAPALADQPQRLAAPEHEIHAVHRLDGADRPPEDHPARHRKVLGELPRLQDRVADLGHRTRRVGRGRRRDHAPPAPRRRLPGAQAGHQVIGLGRLQRRARLFAPRLGERAARGEAAARRHAGEVGRLAVDRGQRLASPPQRRQAVQEPDGIGMPRPAEDLPGRSRLDDPPRVHDRDAIGELRHDAEVVGDEDEGEARFPLDVLQQAQVLSLDRHVERGGRLVGDQEARLAGDGDGAGDALADAAAHLVRVGVDAALRIADPHLAQQLEDPRVERPTPQIPVQA
jgi:hypothetical protein